MKEIAGFRKEYRWLSNFFPSIIEYEGEIYNTVEHAYQAAKTNNKKVREIIRGASTPTDAKSFGRMVPLREDWHEVKLEIMYKLIRLKFQVPDLRQRLLNTGSSIITEDNHWGDTFWGVCKGSGHNHLGKIIMRVRDELKKIS